MTKKLRFVLITVFAIIACVCILSGCNLKPSLNDVLDDLNQKGNTVDVTYFANEGSFNGNVNSKVRTVRYKPGNKAMDIGNITYVSGSITIAAKSTYYEFVGWYEAEVDSDGKPVCIDGSRYEFNYDASSFGKEEGADDKTPFNENKYIRKLKDEHDNEVPFDFDTVLEKGTHYYLVAKYEKVPTVRVALAGAVSSIKIVTTDNSGDEPVVNETVVNLGEEVTRLRYPSDGLLVKPTRDPVSGVSGAAFVEFYADKECKNKFEDWPIKLSEHEDEDVENPFTIYGRYIEGDWDVVKTANQVVSMFTSAGTASKRYFIFGDIDCGGMQIAARTGTAGFGCEICGDEGKIQNIKVDMSLSRNVDGASLFGDIKSTAKIKNLVIENVEQVYTVNESAKVSRGIYFAFTSIASGAQIEGVKITGSMKVTINNVVDNDTSDKGTIVTNLSNGSKDHWKFGGIKSGTEFTPYNSDADYTGGISLEVSELDLTINEAK